MVEVRERSVVGLGQSTATNGANSVSTATQQFEYPVEEWFTGEYASIPERMQEAIKRYVIDHVRPGQFLMAVICNNLRDAVNYADDENLLLIRLYVQWFYNRAPSSCHGSPTNMVTWIERA